MITTGTVLFKSALPVMLPVSDALKIAGLVVTSVTQESTLTLKENATIVRLVQ